MKTNDFSKYLSGFFTEYLSSERGVSHNTIRSYSETFSSLLDYMGSVQHIVAERLTLNHLTRQNVVSFLDWLQEHKGSKDSTRNQRLAAVHAFAKYMQYEDVAHLEQWQNILSIKIKKNRKTQRQLPFNRRGQSPFGTNPARYPHRSARLGNDCVAIRQWSEGTGVGRLDTGRSSLDQPLLCHPVWKRPEEAACATSATTG